MFRLEGGYWWYRGMRRIVRALLPEAFAATPRPRVLDAGCGTGAHLETMGGGTGADLSFEGLRFCRRRRLPRLVCCSVEALPFRRASFDVVSSLDVLYSVPDDRRALGEVQRVLRGGGTLLAGVPAFESLRSEHDVATRGLRRYRRKDLVRLVEGAGFMVERATYANTFLFLPIALHRWFRKSRGAAPGEARSDFEFAPPFLDGLFARLLFLEAVLLRWISFPVGVTLMVRARRRA